MGSYIVEDVVNRVWVTLRDYGQTAQEQLLTDTEIGILLPTAERMYSAVRPRPMMADLTGDGTHYLAVPTDWEEGFSTILSAESPPDAVPPNTLDPRGYRVALDGDGAPRLVFDDAIALGVTVRIAYTLPRTYSATTSTDTTIIDGDHWAVCDLTASICADAIAGKYARTGEPVLGADVTNYRSRVSEWQSIAKRLYARWQAVMGITGEDSLSAPASAWVNWDSRASWGASRLTHPSRTQ